MKWSSKNFVEVLILEETSCFKHSKISGENQSRTSEERAAFTRELAPLFKIKRVTCGVMKLDGFQIVVSKVDKKVFYVKGFELLLIAEFLPSGVMKWQPTVQKEVQDAYDLMMTSK